MESLADDPELAKELVKLLGQELKAVKAQLQEAKAVAVLGSLSLHLALLILIIPTGRD
jgi:hypothetical protein